jgi:hypothetical protein
LPSRRIARRRAAAIEAVSSFGVMSQPARKFERMSYQPTSVMRLGLPV